MLMTKKTLSGALGARGVSNPVFSKRNRTYSLVKSRCLFFPGRVILQLYFLLLHTTEGFDVCENRLIPSKRRSHVLRIFHTRRALPDKNDSGQHF